MEKYGVKKEVLYEELRHEEARLMQEMQALMAEPGEKTASQRQQTEAELNNIRNKITELDLGKR